MQIDILTWEEIIDSWQLFYAAPDGMRSNGRCTVTRKNIYYNNPTGEVRIAKCLIRQIEVKRTLFRKRIVITTYNGEQHTFRCNGIKAGRVVEAINRR